MLRRVGTKNKQPLYKIKFIKTNYITKVVKSQIKDREVRDRFKPTIAGVGYLGEQVEEYNRKLYKTWSNMINRCYKKSHNSYYLYGKKGITVEKSWHNYNNFYYEAKELEGWNRNKFKNGKIFLDKDKKQFNIPISERIYSKKTCCWLSRKEQNRLTENQKKFKAISPTGKIYYAYYQIDFANKFKELNPKRISDVLNGKLNTYKGWTFEFV